MNSLERVLAAVNGQTIPGRAATMTLSLYGARLTGAPLWEHYNQPQLYADGQSAVKQQFDSDILLAPFALAMEGEIFGSALHYGEKSPPIIASPLTTDVLEVAQLPLPDFDSNDRILFLREALRQIVKRHAADTAVAAISLSPIDIPAMVMGVEAWLQAIVFQPDLAWRAFEQMVPYFLQRVDAAKSDGAHFLILPTLILSTPVITRFILENLVIPWLTPVFALSSLPLVMHHTGAPFNPFIDLVASLPNVAAVLVDTHDSLTQSRNLIGPDKLLMGGIDGTDLHNRSLEQVETTVDRVRKNRLDDPRFILASSAADVSLDTDPALILAWFKAAHCD